MFRRTLVVVSIMILISTSHWSPVTPSGFDSFDVITVDDEGDGDYLTIHDAVSNASSGDIILVYSGRYNETVSVNVSVVIRGVNQELGNGSDTGLPWVDGKGSGDVFDIGVDNVTLSGFRISGGDLPSFGAGVYVHSNGCTVKENDVFMNNYGVVVEGSDEESVYNNVIQDNIIRDNKFGLDLFYSENTTVEGNHFVKCGVGVYGKKVTQFLHKMTNNVINDLNLFYEKNRKGLHLSGVNENFGSVILVNCSDVVIEQMDISSTDIGVELAFCSDVVIKDSRLANNVFGLYVYCSPEGVVIRNNSFVENSEAGICIRESGNESIELNVLEKNFDGVRFEYSTRSDLDSNSLCNNSNSGVFLRSSYDVVVENNDVKYNADGVDIYYSYNTMVSDNHIRRNLGNGVFISKGQNNTVIDNTIEYNGRCGVEMKKTSYNKIASNIISYCEYRGIQITDDANRNTIYHNYLWFNGRFWDIVNGSNAWDECHNTWNLSYPSNWEDWRYTVGDPWCGNHWSDQLHIDRMKGPDQDYLGEDKVVDFPYSIPGGDNTDWYPLTSVLDKLPPYLVLVRPFPGFLYVFGVPYDWKSSAVVVIGDLQLEAMATDQGEYPSGGVEVRFKLINVISGKTLTSVWISKPPFTWDLSDFGSNLFGSYYLNVTARDAEGNKNYTNMYLSIFKPYWPWKVFGLGYGDVKTLLPTQETALGVKKR